MTDAAPSPPAPAEVAWRRLHPLSPLVRFGHLILALLVLSLPTFGAPHEAVGRGGQLTITIRVALVLAAISAIAAVVSWAVTRWRISGSDLQIESGLLRRQSLRIPLSRVQAVDVVAPLAGRILGVAEVRVISAGRGGQRGRLAYLAAAEAAQTRARLLALAHGLAADTPEPAALAIARVDNARLVLALCMRSQVLAPLVILAAFIGVAVAVPRGAPALLGTALSTLLPVGVALWRAFNDEFDFSISEAGDGFRLDRGLLQKRHETIPFGRVQAVRVVRPLLWRAAGWVRLEVDVARQRGGEQTRDDSSQVVRTLLPVGHQAEVAAILARVFPHAGLAPPPAAHPPRRARFKAPLSYHFLASWYGGRYVYARTGRLQESLVVVPLEKVQSVRLETGPVQRLLRLATVHVDTAGHRWAATCRCRDAAEADDMVWALTGAARTARRRERRTAALTPA